MSAETRFRTLVTHTTAIYASSPENRAQVLKDALLDLVNVIQPTDTKTWGIVKTDSERLLRVWASVEDDSYYANTIVDQLWDLLDELASQMPLQGAGNTPSPALIISDTILHVQEDEEEKDEIEIEIEVEVEEEKEEEEKEEEQEEVEEVEEEALEVEQMFVRGRSYWVDIKTQKLYADVDEEVGDEVGAIVNGKPVFLSPK